jgi:hypothetical protein
MVLPLAFPLLMIFPLHASFDKIFGFLFRVWTKTSSQTLACPYISKPLLWVAYAFHRYGAVRAIAKPADIMPFVSLLKTSHFVTFTLITIFTRLN